jgi:hypothetical protein
MQRFSTFLLVMLLSTTTFLTAHDKAAHDRTPWGDPDLQGVWSNQTPTPPERPDALAGKATLSEEEAPNSRRRRSSDCSRRLLGKFRSVAS